MHIFRYNDEGTERRRDVIGAAPKIMRVPVYVVTVLLRRDLINFLEPLLTF